MTELSRREALTGIGASVAYVGSGSGPVSGEVQPGVPICTATTAGLVALPVDGVDDGTVAMVAGYHEPGDGGAGSYRWDRASLQVANGGTVLAPHDRVGVGRWVALHDGTVDFLRFGITDASMPADDALDALVSDPTVREIRASTPLSFARRHVFSRSGLVLEFADNVVTTSDIEPTESADPMAAVLCFRGSLSGDVYRHTLTSEWPEYADVVDVGTTEQFDVGQWWIVVSDLATWDSSPPGYLQRELDRLVKVTEVVDGSRVRINYRSGWNMAAGRTLTWARASPVRDVTVRNLVFVGKAVTPDDDTLGSAPIAFDIAVDCNVSSIRATRTFYSLVARMYNTGFRTERCELVNPVTMVVGGAGYLADHRQCLYGHVAECHGSNTRHVINFTGSAYCSVRNCTADGDANGAFITHGQYEHDIEFVGNSGLTVIAGSGAIWGGRAKRIVVRDHRCTELAAHERVVDLTLDNVHAVMSTTGHAGWIRVNADGAQIRGCVAEGGIWFSGRSQDSLRPTVISSSRIQFTAPGTELIAEAVTSPVDFENVVLTGIDGQRLSGSGATVFCNCSLHGAGPGASPLLSSADSVAFIGGIVLNSGIATASGRDQSVTADGGVQFAGQNRRRATFSRDSEQGAVRWNIGNCSFVATDADHHHLRVMHGQNDVRVVGASFEGGIVEVAPAAVDPDRLVWIGCTTRDVALRLP